MDAIEAIQTRRSIAKLGPDRPSREQTEVLLDAAVRAPNHHLTEPWRFIVLAGEALEELGEAMADRVRSQYRDSPDLDQRIALERQRPHRAPVIVTVVFSPSDNPKAVEVEDRYAVGGAMQNILLAAHALGLGAYLRTGPGAYDARVARYLGLGEREEIAGFIYVGQVADEVPPPSPRTPATERTQWRGWDRESSGAGGNEG